MEDLEKLVREKIIPINESLGQDITSMLKYRTIAGISLPSNLSYRDAKKNFRRQFLTGLLRLNLGNLSQAAKQADISRKTLHRLTKRYGIDIQKIRSELLKPYDLELLSVNNILEKTATNYKIKSEQLREIYHEIATETIINNLPKAIGLKEAENEFDKTFFSRANEKNIKSLAKKIGLSYKSTKQKLIRLSQLS